MSKKPLADDRRREQAGEAFAKLVRAAFKGEADKANEVLATIESQFGEETDIVERARAFAHFDKSGAGARPGKPRNAQERFLGAIMSLNAGDEDAALKELSAIVADQPGNADAHYALAIVHARRNNVEGAVASLKTACSLAPARQAQAPLDAEFAALAGKPEFDALFAA